MPTFEQCCRDYFQREYPDMEILSISPKWIKVLHPDTDIRFSIPFYEEHALDAPFDPGPHIKPGRVHLVEPANSFRDYINHPHHDKREKVCILGESGYLYGDMVELHVSCGEHTAYRDLEHWYERDAKHYYHEDDWEYQELHRLIGLEESRPFYHLHHFLIGDVDVHLGNPSDLYKLWMDPSNRYFQSKKIDFSNRLTLRLKGIDKDNYMDYIAQACFIIDEKYWCDEYPHIVNSNNWDLYHIPAEHERSIPLDDQGRYAAADFPLPIQLYNMAQTADRLDEAFLYHYRVLEFFLGKLNDHRLISLLKEYELSAKSKSSDENAVKFLSVLKERFFKQQERTMVKNALETLPSATQEYILRTAREGGILEEESEATGDIVELADKLYSYRNSIVHSKYEQIKTIRITNIFDDQEGRTWKQIMETISQHLVVKYCYHTDTGKSETLAALLAKLYDGEAFAAPFPFDE